MTNSKIWAILANCSFVEIYEREPGKEIKKILHEDCPEGRERSGEILSDRPGRTFDSVGHGRHAVGTEVDVHLHELKIFAHRIAEIAHKGYSDLAYEKLVIIAPPQLLGELRRVLSDPVKKAIFKEIKKDLHERLTDAEKLDHLYRLLEIKRPERLTR